MILKLSNPGCVTYYNTEAAHAEHLASGAVAVSFNDKRFIVGKPKKPRNRVGDYERASLHGDDFKEIDSW